MKSRLLSIFTLLLVLGQVFAQQKNQKPNILFIAVDDLKPELGCYGNSLIKTPNIDRLAKMGTVFVSNYCQQSVCGPTRASLMTGMRPDVTEIWDLRTQMRDMNPDIVTLPQYLITQGYTTVGIGKIYHPSSSEQRIDPVSWSLPYLFAEASDYPNGMGKPANTQYQFPATKALFDKPAKKPVAETSKNDEGDDLNPTSRKGPSSECIDVPDNAYEDGANALIAKDEIIKLVEAKSPFFFAVGFKKPHLPFVAPKKYWDMYNRNDMPIASFQEHSQNGPLIAYHKSGELRNYTDIPEFATRSGDSLRIGLTLDKQKELIHGYYAAVSYTDAQVGILLNTLESLGELNNTIIVLWGDHGWHLGDHDLWQKHTNFEQATRSPLLIAAPGYKSGATTSLSEHVDIFPTICDLAGLSIPSQLDGKSLLPIMKDKNDTVKHFAVSQYPRNLSKLEQSELGYENGKLMGYAFRTDKYRYVVWIHDFTSKDPFNADKIYAKELYDYTNDPLEKVNVIDNPAYIGVAKDLYNTMETFFESQLK